MASTRMTHNSGDVAADGHIVICWKRMTAIIDQSQACVTGPSNDKCETRQQVDGIASPLLSQRESPSPTYLWCSRERKTWKSFLSFTTVSFFSSSLCVCVCAHLQHNCSISSGFSPCYPLKKKKGREKLQTGFQLPLWRRHTVLTADIFYASCSKAQDAIYSATGEQQTNQSAMKTTRAETF